MKEQQNPPPASKVLQGPPQPSQNTFNALKEQQNPPQTLNIKDFYQGGGSLRNIKFQKLSNNNILYIVWVLVAFITLALSVYVTQIVMQRLEKKEYKHPVNKNVTFSLIFTFVYSCIFVLYSLLSQSIGLLVSSLSVCAVSGMSLYMAHVFSVC